MILALLPLLLVTPRLEAAPVDDLLAATLKAIQEKNYSDARRFIERTVKIMPDADAVVPYPSQARLWFFNGLVEWNVGDRNQAALEYWRQTLMVDSEFQWDAERFPDDEAESVFESLRREVNSRSTVSLGIPEDTRSMRIFVGGRPVDSESARVEGKYLLQVVCSDGAVFGRWWKYGKPPKYQTLCPDGYGPIPAVSASEGSNGGLGLDEYGVEPTSLATLPPVVTPEIPAPSGESNTAKGKKNKAAEKEKALAAEKEKALAAEKEKALAAEKEKEKTDKAEKEKALAAEKEKEKTDKAEKEKALAAEKEKEKADKAEKERERREREEAAAQARTSESSPGTPREARRGPMARPVFFWSGVGLLTAGGGVYLGLANPAWSDIVDARGDPASLKRDEADALSARYNAFRFTTLGLLGLGVVGIGGSFVSDLPVSVGPGSLLVHGSF